MAKYTNADVIEAALDGGYTVTPRVGYTPISRNGRSVLTLHGEKTLNIGVLAHSGRVDEAVKAGGDLKKQGWVIIKGDKAQAYLADVLLEALRTGSLGGVKRAADLRVQAAVAAMTPEQEVAVIAAEAGVTTGQIYDLLYGWEAAPAPVAIPTPRKARTPRKVAIPA